MKRTLVAVATILVMFTAAAGADDTDALIALDRQWGESGVKGDMSVAKKVLADNVVSVTENGVRGKQGELDDNEPAPAGTVYKPADYKVTFVDANTAVMTHGTEGENAHHSLHVWSRKGDTWQIVATSTTPAAGAK